MLNGAVATAAPAPVAQDDVAELVDDADGQEDGEDDLPPLEPPSLATLAKSDAIRIAVSRRPGYTPAGIADLLATYDVHVAPEYVRQVLNRDRQSTGADVVPIRKA